MTTIEPVLFARLMRLPASVRTDLLEFLGATPFDNALLSKIIDSFADKRDIDKRSFAADLQ